MRLVLAVLAGAATAVLGALILGEYPHAGITGVIAGALFGLAVAEMVLTVGGDSLTGRATFVMIAVAAFTAAGLAWAGWIFAGHLWGEVPLGAWLGVVVGAALGPWWLQSGMRRAAPAPAGES